MARNSPLDVSTWLWMALRLVVDEETDMGFLPWDTDYVGVDRAAS